MFFTCGPNGDFDILPQRREKFHKASTGKVTRAVSDQQGDLRLPYAENFGELHLGHAAALEDCMDLQGELRLGQLLLGMGKAQVGEDVSAAFDYAGNAIPLFLGFALHRRAWRQGRCCPPGR